MQREGTRYRIERCIGKGERRSVAVYERQARVVAGAGARDIQHRFAAVETRNVQRTPGTRGCPHQRTSHIAGSRAHVEHGRYLAPRYERAHNRRVAAEEAVRKFDVSQIRVDRGRREPVPIDYLVLRAPWKELVPARSAALFSS